MTKTLKAVLALAVAAVLVYIPVFSHQFQLAWDDQWVVINLYTAGGFTMENLEAIFTDFYEGQYAPLNQLSYTALYALFGYDPFWFHTFGVLLHVANAVLTYFFMLRLLGKAESFERASVQRIAMITALLMAVHPFLVESVAWISASKILIYSFFYLAALHAYLSYLENRKVAFYLLTLFLFVCSFGGKEQAVTLPVCLLLVDYTLKRDLKSRSVWLEKIPFFVLSLIFGYITLLSQGADKVGLLSDAPKYPFYQNIIFASYSITEYLVKCLFPVNLSYLYMFPNAMGENVPLRFWLYPAMLLIIVVSFLDFWKKRWVFFGIVFFIIHLGVALHIIPISRFAIVADRYVYMASIGVFFLIAYFLDKALQYKKYNRLALSGFVVYLIVLGAYGHQHSKIWHDSTMLKKELKDLLKQRNDFQKHQAAPGNPATK
ncbi:hypothetical protein [Pedobacter deserti]|uniref:hypothetical protein n=1 Tax=Pedobacter deserti TaxID=2817382 RepID=UPI00210CC7CF|nr:hypothetical protein [Pedobacter sp. SYSU D00382]